MIKTYEIENLDCAHCAGRIEDEVNKLDGVECKLSFAMSTMKITTEKDIREVEKAVAKIMKRVEPDAKMRSR